MTTGRTGELWEIGPFSSYRYGKYRTRFWAGQDAISANTPRKSYPTVASMPGPKALRAQLTDMRDKLSDLRRRLRKARKDPARDDAYSALSWEYYSLREKYELAKKQEVKRRVDESVERKRLRRLLPPKPYTMTATRSSMPGLYAWHPSWGVSNPEELVSAGSEDYFPPLSQYEVKQNIRNSMMEKIFRKAYGSGFNPLVFLAEGRQALDMIFNAAKSINNALDAVRRFNLRAACYHLMVPISGVKSRENWYRKNMSDRWLELQYGWLPLLGDVKAGAEFLAEAAENPLPFRDKIVVRKVYAEKQVLPVAQRGLAYFNSRMLVVQHQIIIYKFVKAPTGVGIYGVAETAWEKLPWSFIADWFVPIGNLLKSLKTANQISGTVVETVKVDAVYLEPTMGLGYVLRRQALPIGDTLEVTYMNRTVGTELNPLSSATAVADSISNLKEALSWRRAMNAVALITQRS